MKQNLQYWLIITGYFIGILGCAFVGMFLGSLFTERNYEYLLAGFCFLPLSYIILDTYKLNK